MNTYTAIIKKTMDDLFFGCSKFNNFDIEKDEDMYVATCPEVGTVSQGNSVEEALSNLKEATELYLENFPAKNKIKAFLTTFQIAHAHA